MGQLVRSFLGHVMPGVIRPLRILWNQVIGFFFFVLGVYAIPSTLRTIREFDGEVASVFWVMLSTSFVALMLGFAIASFWRARRISRS